MLRNLFSLTILVGSALGLHAAEQTFTSGPGKTHLLELYTSEGCSSCPPAEAWLSRLKDSPRLWRDFAPIAFHVDYWDRLGWRDPYAAKAWTTRQYQYAARWNGSSVYTPGFVLDGREWQNNSAPSAASDSPGTLQVELGDDKIIRATFISKKNSEAPLELHAARLGFGLKVSVRAGENSGRQLQHDFVVLGTETTSMSGGKASLHLPVASAQSDSGARNALVVWLTEPGQLEPIQTAGDWLK